MRRKKNVRDDRGRGRLQYLQNSVVPRPRNSGLHTYITITLEQSYGNTGNEFKPSGVTSYIFSKGDRPIRFKCSDSSEWSDFIKIYDQFRVKSVDVCFTWSVFKTPGSQGTTRSTTLLFNSDPDGGAAPDTYDEFTQRRRVWRFSLPLFDGFTRTIRGLPCSIVGATNQIIEDRWMDCATVTGTDPRVFAVGFTGMLQRAVNQEAGVVDYLLVQLRPNIEFRYRR